MTIPDSIRNLMARNTDLRLAIDAHSNADMFGYSICAGETHKGATFILSVGKDRATKFERQITVNQEFGSEGEIDYTLVLTKALLLYDI